MKFNFYAIHLYITVNGFRHYVNTVNGDRLEIRPTYTHDSDGWYLYVGDTLVTCGDVRDLHAGHTCHDSEYNSYSFDYSEQR